MITHSRRFDVANLQAEHAERLLSQLSLAHSLPSGRLIEAKPCALCHLQLNARCDKDRNDNKANENDDLTHKLAHIRFSLLALFGCGRSDSNRRSLGYEPSEMTTSPLRIILLDETGQGGRA